MTSCQETWQGDDGGTKRMSTDLSSATKMQGR